MSSVTGASRGRGGWEVSHCTSMVMDDILLWSPSNTGVYSKNFLYHRSMTGRVYKRTWHASEWHSYFQDHLTYLQPSSSSVWPDPVISLLLEHSLLEHLYCHEWWTSQVGQDHVQNWWPLLLRTVAYTSRPSVPWLWTLTEVSVHVMADGCKEEAWEVGYSSYELPASPLAFIKKIMQCFYICYGIIEMIIY